MKPYTYKQFCEIANKLLSRHKIEEGIAVWSKSRDIRDYVRICKLARSAEDVKFVVDTFLDTNRMIDE